MQKRTPRVLAGFLLLASLCVSVIPCLAGTQQGFVTYLYVRASDGLVYFYLSGTPKDRPACAQNTTYWMIRDENSTAGKQQLAQLLTAYASGSTLTIYGADKCIRWPDGEDVDNLRLQ